MRYFTISNGPRGMYVANTAFVVGARTRRELKAVIANEAQSLADSYYGVSARAIAKLAADAWSNKGIYDSVMPLNTRRGGDASYGLFVSNATRDDLETDCY